VDAGVRVRDQVHDDVGVADDAVRHFADVRPHEGEGGAFNALQLLVLDVEADDRVLAAGDQVFHQVGADEAAGAQDCDVHLTSTLIRVYCSPADPSCTTRATRRYRAVSATRDGR